MEIFFRAIVLLQFFSFENSRTSDLIFKRVLKIRIVLEWTNAVRKWSLTSSLVLVVTWEFLRYWYGSARNSQVSNFWLVKVTQYNFTNKLRNRMVTRQQVRNAIPKLFLAIEPSVLLQRTHSAAWASSHSSCTSRTENPDGGIVVET